MSKNFRKHLFDLKPWDFFRLVKMARDSKPFTTISGIESETAWLDPDGKRVTAKEIAALNGGGLFVRVSASTSKRKKGD